MNAYQVLAIAVVVALSLLACGEDATTPAPSTPPDTLVPVADTLSAALAAAPGVEERGSAAITPLERAMVGAVPASVLGERDLTQAVVGKEGTFSFDINKDGNAQEIYVFTPDLEAITFLFWSEDAQCQIGWRDGEVSWVLSAPCEGEASEKSTIVCQDTSCSKCDTEGTCQTCAVSGSEVRCEEAVEDEPDMGSDNADMDEDIFVPDRPGECHLECVSQSGAFCCKECGCQGEIMCQPECRTGYRWDCEVGCCFSYDTFSCDCPEGTSWDAEAYSCQ